MRIVLGVLAAFALGVGVGWMLRSREAEPKHVPGAERPALVPTPHASSPPRLEPGTLAPVPDPTAMTPRPGTRARRRTPGAPARLPVDVEVIGLDGGVAKNVMLHWARSETRTDHRRMGWSPEHPQVYLEPGDVWIHATGGSHRAHRSDAVHLVVERDAPRPSIRLVLEEGAGIVGRVVVPAEFLHPPLDVRLQPVTDDVPRSDFSFVTGSRRARPRERDGYVYAFLDLEPGHYAVGLSLGGSRLHALETVRVDAGLVEQDLVVKAFDHGVFVEIAVLGPDGDPVRDARVSTGFRAGQRNGQGGNVQLRLKDGTIVVDHCPQARRDEDGAWEAATYFVRVSSSDYGEITHEYDPNATKKLTVRYAERALVGVVLQGYAASPAANRILVGIRARVKDAVGVHGPREPTAQGRLEFGPRQPGPYDLLLLGPDHRLRWTHALELRPGENRFEIALPEFHSLELHHPADWDDARLLLSRTFDNGSRAWHPGERKEPGIRTFDLLTPGTYQLEAYVGERRVLRTVTIPADRVLRID